MSDPRMLDIQIEVTLDTPDIQIGMLTSDVPDIQIDLGRDTIVHPEYEGPCEVSARLFENTVLGTEKQIMRSDVTVLPIPISEVFNPQGGTTMTIG